MLCPPRLYGVIEGLKSQDAEFLRYGIIFLAKAGCVRY